MSGHDHDSDVLIIGGGPAGISAAIWCADLGLTASIFEEKKEFGGQLLSTFNPVTNYPGIETANGTELRDKFIESLDKRSVRRFLGATVTSADLERKAVTLSGQRSVTGRAIIIATGVRRRRLEVPGENEFFGRGILASGTASKNEVAGKTVVIVGGGDAALENALIVSEKAGHVVLVHRRDKFSARDEFVRLAAERDNIDTLMNSSVHAIIGESHVQAVEIHSSESGSNSRIAADYILIRAGVTPNSELFRGQLDLDDKGYIRINSQCATTAAAVFATGDVANPASPTISTAAGNGASAAKSVQNF